MDSSRRAAWITIHKWNNSLLQQKNISRSVAAVLLFVYVRPVFPTFLPCNVSAGTTTTTITMVVLSPDIAGGVIFRLVKTKVFW